jgi:hypothetical protein
LKVASISTPATITLAQNDNYRGRRRGDGFEIRCTAGTPIPSEYVETKISFDKSSVTVTHPQGQWFDPQSPTEDPLIFSGFWWIME